MQLNALGNLNQDISNAVSPIIASAIDNRQGHENPLNGYVIQDGAMPRTISEILPCIFDIAYEMSLLERTWVAMGRWKKRLFY